MQSLSSEKTADAHFYMLLDKYFSISLRLYDYMAAKILIINEKR